MLPNEIGFAENFFLSSAKIENICRLCLSGDDNLESIFGDSGSELLQTLIYDCTTVKVRMMPIWKIYY